MLTVDFSRFPLAAGDRVLDLGCGAGRHAFECYRRGANVVALDRNGDEIREVAKWFAAMKEAGWLTGTDPQRLLDWLRRTGQASERKQRLFACACCRRAWGLLPDEQGRTAVEVAERFADGAVGQDTLRHALRGIKAILRPSLPDRELARRSWPGPIDRAASGKVRQAVAIVVGTGSSRRRSRDRGIEPRRRIGQSSPA